MVSDVDGDYIGSCAGQVERVWHGLWEQDRSESNVQADMVNISKLLNALPNRSLTWDFEINGMATLGAYKSDGHARLAESTHHRKNVLQHAVLVELKAVKHDGLLTSNESRGASFP
jgi:hypothetical protein